MSERSRTVALAAMLLLVVALSIYDVARAAGIRCVRLGDRYRVLALREMDVLPGETPFRIDRLRSGRLLLTAQTASVDRRAALSLEGALPGAPPNAAAVFAVIDGAGIARADFPSPSSPDFVVRIPPGTLSRGEHRVTFNVVPRSLEGYYVPEFDVRICAF